MTREFTTKTVYVEIVSCVPGRCVFDYWKKSDRSDMLRGDVPYPAKDKFYAYIEDVTGLKHFAIQFVNYKQGGSP